MHSSDILRTIELLNRKQHGDVVLLMRDPNDELARQHFRERQALIRVLRVQLSTQKESPAEGAGL